MELISVSSPEGTCPVEASFERLAIIVLKYNSVMYLARANYSGFHGQRPGLVVGPASLRLSNESRKRSSQNLASRDRGHRSILLTDAKKRLQSVQNVAGEAEIMGMIGIPLSLMSVRCGRNARGDSGSHSIPAGAVLRRSHFLRNFKPLPPTGLRSHLKLGEYLFERRYGQQGRDNGWEMASFTRQEAQVERGGAG